MSCQLKSAPWYNKEEWQGVYDDIYSSDSVRMLNGLCAIEKWESSFRRTPPGVTCSKVVVQVMLKDENYNKALTIPLDRRDLQLMYSAAVMRIVNVITQHAKKEKLTMFQMAKNCSIPDWIIKIRHNISHGDDMPDLDLLRNAAAYLFIWLKKNYWEVEKLTLKDLVREQPFTIAVKKHLCSLLKIYYELKKYFVQGCGLVRAIEDVDIRLEICNASELEVHTLLAEYEPWKYTARRKDVIDPTTFSTFEISKAISVVIKLLKGYQKEDVFCYDTVVKVILEENSNYSKLNKQIWSLLINHFHKWGKIFKLLEGFAKEAKRGRPNEKLAAAWLLELSLSLAKRLKVAELRDSLINDKTPSWVLLHKNNPFYRRAIQRLLLKKRLNLLRHTSAAEVNNILIEKVEKKYACFRNTMNIVEKVTIENEDIIRLISLVADGASPYGFKTIIVLLELMRPQMPIVRKNNLLTLCNIYLGKATYSYKFDCSPENRLKSVENILQTEDEEFKRKKIEEEETRPEIIDGRPVFRHGKKCYGYDWASCPIGVLPWIRDPTLPKPILLR